METACGQNHHELPLQRHPVRLGHLRVGSIACADVARFFCEYGHRSRAERAAVTRYSSVPAKTAPDGPDDNGKATDFRRKFAIPAATPQNIHSMNLYATRTYERVIRKLLSEDARSDMEAVIVAAPEAERDDLTATDRKALSRLVTMIKREGRE